MNYKNILEENIDQTKIKKRKEIKNIGLKISFEEIFEYIFSIFITKKDLNFCH